MFVAITLFSNDLSLFYPYLIKLLLFLSAEKWTNAFSEVKVTKSMLWERNI
jgi:hypothetical protein